MATLRHQPPVSFREDVDQQDLELPTTAARALWFHGGREDRSRALVCLAGMGANGRSFVRQRPLSTDWFTLLLNTPRTTPEGEDPVAFAAGAAQDFIARLRLDRPALVGSSFGGAVAAQVAINAATPLRALVLVGAVLSRWQIPLAFPGFVDLLEAPRPLAQLLAPLAAQIMGAFALDRDAQDEIVREARAFDGAELKRRLLRLLDLDLVPALARAGLPVLFLHGSRDLLVPWRRARAVADQVPGARFELIRGAGHLPYLSHPEAFNEAVRTFLRERPLA